MYVYTLLLRSDVVYESETDGWRVRVVPTLYNDDDDNNINYNNNNSNNYNNNNSNNDNAVVVVVIHSTYITQVRRVIVCRKWDITLKRCAVRHRDDPTRS